MYRTFERDAEIELRYWPGKQERSKPKQKQRRKDGVRLSTDVSWSRGGQ